MDRCPTCDSAEFSVDESAGTRTCLVCGELTEGFQLQVVEEEVQGGFFRLLSQSQSQSQNVSPQRNVSTGSGPGRGAEHAPRHNERKKGKRRGIRLAKRHVDENAYLLAMQWILDRQTDDLVRKCNVNKRVKRTALSLWARYLDATFAHGIDLVDSFLAHRFARESAFEVSLLRKWQLEHGVGQMTSESEGSVLGYHSDSSTYEMGFLGVSDSDSVMASDSDSVKGEANGPSAFVNRMNSTNAPPEPSMALMLGICYISCMLWREPILPTDIERWADNGTLMYWVAYSSMPEQMQDAVADGRQFFEPDRYKNGPTRWRTSATVKKQERHAENHVIVLHARELAAALGVELPVPNFPLIAVRLSYRLGIPSILAQTVALAWCNLAATDNLVVLGQARSNRRTCHRALSISFSCLLSLCIFEFQDNWRDWVATMPENKLQGHVASFLEREAEEDGPRADLFAAEESTVAVPWTLQEVSALPQSSLDRFLEFVGGQVSTVQGLTMPQLSLQSYAVLTSRLPTKPSSSKPPRNLLGHAPSGTDDEVIGPKAEVRKRKKKIQKRTVNKWFVGPRLKYPVHDLRLLLDYIGSSVGEDAVSLRKMFKIVSNLTARRTAPGSLNVWSNVLQSSYNCIVRDAI